MKRLRNLVLVGALMGATLASCVDDPGEVTCQNFDEFLYSCYYNCAASFECEESYSRYDDVIRALLDECSEKMRDQGFEETCEDRDVDGYSCEQLMLDYLGGTCDF